jgi:hypothetical protein
VIYTLARSGCVPLADSIVSYFHGLQFSHVSATVDSLASVSVTSYLCSQGSYQLLGTLLVVVHPRPLRVSVYPEPSVSSYSGVLM